MLYSFLVHPSHRDYLRFVWCEDNDTTKPLVDYRMKVNVFGNGPSPAVAALGLRKTANMAEKITGSDVKMCIYKNFYVHFHHTDRLKRLQCYSRRLCNLFKKREICGYINCAQILVKHLLRLTKIFDYDSLPIQ